MNDQSATRSAPSTPRTPEHGGFHGFSVERVCLVVLATLAVFYTLYFARAILLPATVALLLNLVLKPVTRRLARWGLPGAASATVVFVVFTALAATSVALLTNPARQWLAGAPRTLRETEEKLTSVTGPLTQIQQAKEEVDDMTSLPGEEDALEVRIEQPPLANQMVNTTGGLLTGATITFVLLFFLLSAGDMFLVKTVDLAPTWREKRDVVMVFREIQQKMSAYLGAITLINIGLGVVIGLGLWLIGMPNPLLWGVMAALLNYVPFAGLIVGTGIVSLVALTEFDTLGHVLMAPTIYLVANGLEANFITPAVLGQSISLNPVVILLAIFIGGWVWGVGGVFLAVPVLLVLKITCDHFPYLRPIAVFLAR